MAGYDIGVRYGVIWYNMVWYGMVSEEWEQNRAAQRNQPHNGSSASQPLFPTICTPFHPLLQATYIQVPRTGCSPGLGHAHGDSSGHGGTSRFLIKAVEADFGADKELLVNH